MPLLVPLAALEKGEVRLIGELQPADLELKTLDPCLEACRPVRYDLRARLMGRELMVDGSLETVLDCRCVRCLEPFEFVLRLCPWSFVLVLDGEDAALVVNESVDLTTQVHDDTLLGLPQHPVCGSNCQGVPRRTAGPGRPEGSSGETTPASSAWSILDTLKLD